jgi:hypothetical protein
MNRLNKPDIKRHVHIRLLTPSLHLKIVVWLVTFSVSLIFAFIYDATIVLLIVFLALNILVFSLTTPIADLIASIAENKRKQPSMWFDPDVEREKKHYGPLRANRLFRHPIGKKKWF